MSRTEGKAVHTVMDMWQAYVKQLLAEDPRRYTRYEKAISNYSVYIDIDGKRTTVMYYSKFRRIIEHYFDRAKKEIIHGNSINLNAGLGRIAAKRIERDFRRKTHIRINWNETKKQKLVEDPDVPGKMKYERKIYFTDPDWCRIGWFKSVKIPNIAVYEFSPASANSARTTGFSLEFTQALDKDPLLKFRYLFEPITYKPNGI